MDVEKKNEPPTTTTTTTTITDTNHHHKPTRRRCICICISVITITVLLFGIIILILALTLFKPKKPITTLNSVAIKDLDASVNLLPPKVSLNVSLDLNISLKNPNKVGVKFRNSSAVLSYKGQVVGDVPIPAGEVGSGGTKELNLTLTVFADRLLTNTEVFADFIRGSLPVSTYTRIDGKARVLNLFDIRIVSTSSCDLDISIANRRISDQTCNYSDKT